MQVNCGLIGVGTVGTATLDFFAEGPLSLGLAGSEIGRRTSVPVHVWSASRRSRTKQKAASEHLIHTVLQRAGDGGARFAYDHDPANPGSAFTPGDPAWRRIVSDPEVDIVVELTGSPVAEAIIQEALWSGKSVVTANKKVMSRSGYELVRLAQARGSVLAYEAAAGGGMPIVQMMGTSIGGRVQAFSAIVNGTCNFILSRMMAGSRNGPLGAESPGLYAEALSSAMDAGLAEADPGDDVLGEDSRSKLIILAGLAFGVRLRLPDVYVRGIARRDLMTRESVFRDEDLLVLDGLGLAPRLVAGAQRTVVDGLDRVVAWVSPVVVRPEHPLAGVQGSDNACLLEVESPAAAERGSGRGYTIVVRGPGAGGPETASSVIADIEFCARQMAVSGRLDSARGVGGESRPMYMYGSDAFSRPQSYLGRPSLHFANDLTARFFLRFVHDENRGHGFDAMAGALSDFGVPADHIHASASAPNLRYFITGPVSFGAMEAALESVLKRFGTGRTSLDVLYLPILDGPALGRAVGG